MRLKFSCPLLAVRDVERSKAFYCGLLDQTVTLDFGWNITFSGGFAIQQNFAWLTDLPGESVVYEAHNLELYFETDDLDAFIARLDAFGPVRLVHPPKTHDWGQRVLRVYDPDGHILEIGEDMRVVVARLLDAGKTDEEAARISRHPLEFVRMVREGRA